MLHYSKEEFPDVGTSFGAHASTTWPHGIVYLKHMALFPYDNMISLPVNMEDLPVGSSGLQFKNPTY